MATAMSEDESKSEMAVLIAVARLSVFPGLAFFPSHFCAMDCTNPRSISLNGDSDCISSSDFVSGVCSSHFSWSDVDSGVCSSPV